MALTAVRKHLGMDVAYVSEFVGDKSIFREVVAPGLETLAKVGDEHSLEDVYCRHILEGRLPELMPDTAAYPLAQSMPITDSVPIGSHVSVPIRRSDGSVYGMFCCLSFEPKPSLNERDLEFARAFADVAAHQIAVDLELERDLSDKRGRITAALGFGGFSLAFQPIWDFGKNSPKLFECLTRFPIPCGRSTDLWFADAGDVGLGVELELAVFRAAIDALARLPAHVALSINTSPNTIVHDDFKTVIKSAPLDRIVLEITEHAPIADYPQLISALEPLRKAGVALAIDDAGAGFSSLRHIIQLKPDLIKLDMTLTRDIDKDLARQALASALIYFADQTGCEIIAEGIESPAELDLLKTLGVRHGQGYLLGRPASLEWTIETLTPLGRSRRMTG